MLETQVAHHTFRIPLLRQWGCGVLLALTSLALSLNSDLSYASEQDQPTSQIQPSDVEIESPMFARIAIIMDDIGYNRKAGQYAIALPGNITFAVIPFTPFGRALAEQAYFSDKEVMLHLPMESENGNRLDIGGITSLQSKYEVKARVKNALNELPFVAGFNNHMGSLLTTDQKAMQWIMEEVTGTPLYFLDSVTHADSIASQVAQQFDIPNLRRDVFIDATPTTKNIETQFNRLIKIAHQNGYAVGIAHPHPATLKYLAKNLPQLNQHKIELVSASDLLEHPMQKTAVKKPLNNKTLIKQLASLPSPKSTRFILK